MTRTSTPESRAAQARLAVADREARSASEIAEDYRARVKQGTASPEQYKAAAVRAGMLARSAESARQEWLAERYIALLASAVQNPPTLTPEHMARIQTILVNAGLA
jgi:hypothetical protein